MFLKNLLLLFIICINLFAKDKITLYPDWLDQFQFAGYYMAKEKGYYDDLGLDVEIKPFNQNVNIVNEVLNNSATYGIGKSSLILEKYNGKDIVFISSIFQESPLILLSLKNKNINSISDLKNKRIMITNDAIESATIKSILNSEKGFDIKDIELLKHSGNIDDLISNKVDVMACYLSNEPYTLSKKNIDFNYFSTNYLNFNFYEGVIFTSKSEATTNPLRVQSFDKASLMGWEYAFDNVEESARIIYEKYNSQNKSLDELIYEGNVLKELAKFDKGLLGDINKYKVDDIKKFYTFSGINKSLNTFTPESIIFKKDYLVLNKTQKNYLAQNQFAILLKDFKPPFSFKFNGLFKGFEIDIWNLLSSKLEKQFSTEETLANNPFLFISDSIKVNFIYSYEQPNKNNKIYTRAINQIPLVLATKDDKRFIVNFDLLENKKIGVLKSLNIKGKLLSLYPKIEFVEFNDDKSALTSLLDDTIYAYINDIYSLNSAINQNNYKDIRINSSLDLSISSFLELDAKDKEFKNILNLAISKLTQNELTNIFNSYTQISINESINYEEYLKIVVPLLSIIALILYLNYRLSKEIVLRKKTQKELLALTIYDTLTGVFNRRKIEETTAHEMKLANRYKTSFSIIFFDLNDFKPINDNFGHHAGDEVLQKVAKSISTHIRSSDSLGRWGGDEFLITLPQTNISQANTLINLLQSHLKNIEFSFDKNLKMSCSFGAYEYQEEDNLDDMIKKADAVMYDVKAKYKEQKKD